MAQPKGYVNFYFTNHVCHLKKKIYGLKQNPHSWYDVLKSHITNKGFVKSESNGSLFIFTSEVVMMCNIVYVDDIIITRNYATLVTHVINSLAYKFSLKNLGKLNSFLGIEVCS